MKNSLIKQFRNIHNFEIDQSKIYKSHKPMITIINSTDVNISNINPIYFLRRQATKNISICEKANNMQDKHCNKILHFINETDQFSLDEKRIISHIVTLLCYYSIIKNILYVIELI